MSGEGPRGLSYVEYGTGGDRFVVFLATSCFSSWLRRGMRITSVIAMADVYSASNSENCALGNSVRLSRRRLGNGMGGFEPNWKALINDGTSMVWVKVAELAGYLHGWSSARAGPAFGGSRRFAQPAPAARPHWPIHRFLFRSRAPVPSQ